MGRHLEDAVGRGINDPVPGAAVLLAVLVQHRSPRGGLVSQNSATGAASEFVDQRRGKAGCIGGEWRFEDQPADLPMPRGTVLSRTGRLAYCVGGFRCRSR